MKLILALSTICLSSVFGYLENLNFDEWKKQHQISFTAGENNSRLQHFLHAKTFVKEHNKRYAEGLESYTVSLNQFSAMSQEEFAEKYLQKEWEAGTYGESQNVKSPGLILQYSCPSNFNKAKSFPSSYKSSYVTSVKDQGGCGSCWAFGAGAAIEAAMCKAGKFNCNSWSGVSAQQLVDCASNGASPINPYDNGGCQGGFQSNALKYVFDYSKGIESWTGYPYLSGNSGKEYSCGYSSKNSIGSISSCGRLGTANDRDLMCSMIYEHGAATVAIDASGMGFRLYDGGLYNPASCSATRLNHAVTATGYGQTDGTNSLTIKNSWGASWGDAGYIYFPRVAGNLACGAFSEGQYAIV